MNLRSTTKRDARARVVESRKKESVGELDIAPSVISELEAIRGGGRDDSGAGQ